MSSGRASLRERVLCRSCIEPQTVAGRRPSTTSTSSSRCGYRVKSKRGTQFRIWATDILRDYLRRGYALNETTIAERLGVEAEQAIESACDHDGAPTLGIT